MQTCGSSICRTSQHAHPTLCANRDPSGDGTLIKERWKKPWRLFSLCLGLGAGSGEDGWWARKRQGCLREPVVPISPQLQAQAVVAPQEPSLPVPNPARLLPQECSLPG